MITRVHLHFGSFFVSSRTSDVISWKVDVEEQQLRRA